ncbi:MAG: BrnT family toxin [Crocosphaera sp.]
MEREDKRDYGEIRIQVIGIVSQVVLFVVYTKRDNRYRIISARRANKNERRQYYQSKT